MRDADLCDLGFRQSKEEFRNCLAFWGLKRKEGEASHQSPLGRKWTLGSLLLWGTSCPNPDADFSFRNRAVQRLCTTYPLVC